jgi:hypothetical protein
MVKIMMGVIMLLALLSRAVVIPVYLSEPGQTAPMEEATATMLKDLSFGLLIFALTVGTVIVFSALLKGVRSHRLKQAAEGAPVGGAFTPPVPEVSYQLLPTGLDRLLIGSISERVIGSAVCPVMVVKL